MLENMADGSESHGKERILLALAADAHFLSRYIAHYKVEVSALSDTDTGKSEDLNQMYDLVKDVL